MYCLFKKHSIYATVGFWKELLLDYIASPAHRRIVYCFRFHRQRLETDSMVHKLTIEKVPPHECPAESEEDRVEILYQGVSYVNDLFADIGLEDSLAGAMIEKVIMLIQ